VSKNTAQLLGAIAAMLVMSWVFWQRLGPRPCSGGLFIELHPPLAEPGLYRFRVAIDGTPPCEFAVPLPVKADVDTKRCHWALELKTQTRGNQTTIAGLTVGAAPKWFQFQVKRNGESLYDTRVEPKYTPYPTQRHQNKRFCGEQAFVKPPCVRGSSECAPYRPMCSGPQDCPKPKACCVSPEWARDYGAKAASECGSTRGCLDRFALLACRADSDCPEDMACDDTSVASEFDPPLTTCRRKAAAR